MNNILSLKDNIISISLRGLNETETFQLNRANLYQLFSDIKYKSVLIHYQSITNIYFLITANVN